MWCCLRGCAGSLSSCVHDQDPRNNSKHGYEQGSIKKMTDTVRNAAAASQQACAFTKDALSPREKYDSAVPAHSGQNSLMRRF